MVEGIIANILKIIHYCWFGGGEIPLNLKEYMATWHEKMPDYKITYCLVRVVPAGQHIRMNVFF